MEIKFMEAANYTKVSLVRPRKIRLIVIHDMEAPENVKTAENVARYFQNKSVRASCHLNIDSDSIVRSVLDRHVAWAAPGANNDGLQYEHAGYAKQTKHEWLDAYGTKLLNLSAKQAAADCRKYKMPIRLVSAADLIAGGSRRHGLTTHANVTAAFHESTHTDPGNNFPMGWYLARVLFFFNAVSLLDVLDAYRLDSSRLKPVHPVQMRRIQKALGFKVCTGAYRGGTKRAIAKQFPASHGKVTPEVLQTLGKRGKFDVAS
jgi:hypothetical protein